MGDATVRETTPSASKEVLPDVFFHVHQLIQTGFTYRLLGSSVAPTAEMSCLHPIQT